MQARCWFAFGDAEDHYKYRAVVMQAYPAGRFPVFAGHNYMQYLSLIHISEPTRH